MSARKVRQLVSGIATSDGAGVNLKRIIGQPALQRLDPFLLLDEFGSDQPQDYIAGFPEHPHRGFQTVTYMLEGKMGHKDSVGNAGVIESGGIQWMNAGRGIIHSEMPQQTEGLLRGFQLWVNLPASEKLSAPGYQDIPPSAVSAVELNEHTRVKVLAGEFNGVEGPVSTQAVKPLFLDVISEDAGELRVPLPSSHTAFVYVYEGAIDIQGQAITAEQIAVLGDGEQVQVSWSGASRFILLAGAPIGEPIVQYGPFVMNTQDEIHQALRDYQSGALA